LKNLSLILGLLVAPAAFVQAQTAPPNLSRESKALIQGSLMDFDAKNYDQALQKLKSLEASMQDDPFVLNLLGAAYTKKKDYTAAQGYFEKALAKQPDFFPQNSISGSFLPAKALLGGETTFRSHAANGSAQRAPAIQNLSLRTATR